MMLKDDLRWTGGCKVHNFSSFNIKAILYVFLIFNYQGHAASCFCLLFGWQHQSTDGRYVSNTLKNSKTLILIPSINVFAALLSYWCTVTMTGCVTPSDLSFSTGQTVKIKRNEQNRIKFRRSKVADKSLKIFPGAKHQLFLELESTRSQVFSEIENWIERRI